MSNKLRTEIYNRMKLKETDELLAIWQDNNRFEWSDEAFAVIKEILQERDVDIPEQSEAIYEHHEEDSKKSIHEFSRDELEIIDDDNPPAFYDPFEVLLTTKQLEWMLKVMVAFIILYNIVNFPNSAAIVRGFFFLSAPNPLLGFVVSLLVAFLNAILAIVVMYVPLKILTRILRILMEMEFNSRKTD